MPLTIECEEFKPLVRNTLRGFATITIKEMRLRVKDVALHVKNDRQWAALPAKPQIKDGAVIIDASGKAQYTNVFEFTDRPTSDAFSRAVIDAVQKSNPTALNGT
jgi:hypothetical protein